MARPSEADHVPNQALPAERYARAERFLPWNAARLTFGMGIDPQWIDDATAPDLVTAREQLQALADEFDTAGEQTRRLEIAKEAQTIFYENQLTVWMWHRQTVHAIQPRLKGYRLTHAGRIVELDKAYLEG